MASRTRQRLIDVARQLFARKGIENTTMNDIATASDRGRRTIYTYFRTKDDIYEAVVEEEASRVLAEIDAEIAKADTPASKLRALMDYRVRLANQNPTRYEMWIKSLFSRNVQRAAIVRERVAQRLYELTDEIVNAGIAVGDFIPEQARRLPAVLTMLIRGSDTSMARDTDYAETARWLAQCSDFIIQGACLAPNPQNSSN